MEEMDKRIHLSFFVLFFMNLFYSLVTNNYSYLIYFVFALVISYFVIYQENFFLILNNAKSFGKRFISHNKRIIGTDANLDKGYQGTNLHPQMEDNRDESKRQQKEGNSKESIESSRERVDNSLYY